MKKITISLILSLLLCGCNNNQQEITKKFSLENYNNKVEQSEIIEKGEYYKNQIYEYYNFCRFDYKYDYILGYQSINSEKIEVYVNDDIHHTEEKRQHNNYQIQADKDNKTKKQDFYSETIAKSPEANVNNVTERKEFGQTDETGTYTIDLINRIYYLKEFELESYLYYINTFCSTELEEILQPFQQENVNFYLDDGILTYHYKDLDTGEGYEVGEEIIKQIIIKENYAKCISIYIRKEVDKRDEYMMYTSKEYYEGFELKFEDQNLLPYKLEEIK